MSIISLAGALQKIDSDRVCLITAQRDYTIGQLLTTVQALRMNSPELAGARLALRGLSPLELVLSATAFDGMVSQLLLLPASLDEATASSLIIHAGCTHVLDGGSSTCKALVSTTPSAVERTQWLLATSGTTATPKLIQHTLPTLTYTVKRDLQRGADYKWGLLYDPCRFAGLQVVLQALLSGSSLVLPDHVVFEEQLAVMLQNSVNALSATPTLWRKMLMDGRIIQLPLRQLTLGGEIVDQSIIDALKARFKNARIIHIYASTEAGAGFAVQDGQAGFPAAWLNNPVHSPALRVGNNRHLFIKPIMLPKGSEIDQRLTPDRYLDTEDLVSVIEERVYFLGRASGVINVGGNKVNPEEVENYLRHIDSVVDARVYAKANSMMGQIVAAEVIAEPGGDTKLLRQRILQQCRQNFESWQVPVLISFVSALKETAAGKKERKLS